MDRAATVTCRGFDDIGDELAGPCVRARTLALSPHPKRCNALTVSALAFVAGCA